MEVVVIMFGNKLDKIPKLVEGGKEAALIKLAKDKDKTVKLAAIAALGLSLIHI